ncbi:MAG: NRDE family protein [Lautropia sp.]
MCLIGFALDPPGPWALVIAANRDEYHQRASEPAHWWPGGTLFAGRDRVAGGTWLGLARTGSELRIGALTNIRPGLRRGSAVSGAMPSRGTLVTGWLNSVATPGDFLAALAGDAGDYAGFNLLAIRFRAASHALAAGYLDNAATPAQPRALAAGVYAVSNATIDVPWPKTRRIGAAIGGALASHATGGDAARLASDLFDALADRHPAVPVDLPSTGLDAARERLLSSIFIVDPVYGTRCSTVIVVGRDGRTWFEERSFGPDGDLVAMVREVVAPAADQAGAIFS